MQKQAQFRAVTSQSEAGEVSPEEFLVDFRGSLVIEQEIARRLYSDFK
jgi:hypothetical protein